MVGLGMVEGSEAIKKHVRERYSGVARRTEQMDDQSCCDVSSCCSSSYYGSNLKVKYAQGIGYSQEELGELPDTVVGACAGCGNPTALAGLKGGEVVLDLGSGGGIDVFLAAKKVGPQGKAIGVDMTDEMIELAKRNAEKMDFTNVKFRLGDIDNLPAEDESVDVVISNCVINLSPDKDKVFQEAYRVLKPGGRITISDIVTDGELPIEIRENPDMWSACIAGALDQKLYIEKISNAGFQDIKILSRRASCSEVGSECSTGSITYSIEIEAHKPEHAIY